MKILIIYHYNDLGGGTLSGIDIARALCNDYDIKISIPLISKNLKEKIGEFPKISYINGPSVPTFSYYNGGGGFLKTMIKYATQFKNYEEWKDLLKAEKPDLLIFNSIVQWPLLVNLVKLNIPCMLFVRETMRGKLFWPINSYIKKKLEMATGVAFLTEYDKKQWIGKKRAPANWTVIPDVVDKSFHITSYYPIEDLRKQEGLSKEDFVILYLGGFSKIKGILRIVNAMKYFSADTEIQLIILGNSSISPIKNGDNFINLIRRNITNIYRSWIENKIFRINSKGRKILVKGLQIDVGKWYRISDLVVFPVAKVHQARPVYEAGIYKKPIIVPNYDNFRETVVDDFNGLYYNKNSSRDLANKILTLSNNKSYCKWLGNNNFEFTIKNHEFEKMSEYVLGTVRKVLKLHES